MNEKIIASLGLAGRELKVYRALLKVPEVTPVALSKMTGIKRTTAYSIARSLSEKGLLVENSTKRPRTFSLASPKEIDALIADERMKFAARENMFKELSVELSRATAQKTYPVPQIRFIEEDKIEQFLFKQTPLWWKSMLATHSSWFGFQDHTFVEHFRDWIDWQWKKAPTDISLKLLSNRSEAETKLSGKYPRRAIKFWDKTDSFLSTTWVTGDYVCMINTRKHPFYLVEIHDATLANDQREVFKNLWPLV